MKRILQSLKTGITEIVETPCPKVKTGHILIKTSCSLISPGTEKMLIDFGKASLLEKVKQQPDKVRMVIDKIRTDGLRPTLEAVQDKLDQKLPLGYSNVGTIIAIGNHVSEFAIGDRVVSNGSHAEIVCVAKNLCCKIPDEVTDAEASFVILGAIALQGIRLAKPTLGECFVVIGLGLIGLLTVQLLKAQGCRVLGVDFDAHKLSLAKLFGAEVVNLSMNQNPLTAATIFSRYRGVDGVLITASTKSNDPIKQAASMSRKKGRIILIGVTGLELSRADFYEKELTFQVSCSYGPGRYDTKYEEQGEDYPLAFVRWPVQRNFEAILDMLAFKKINITSLITKRFDFTQAKQAYDILTNNKHSLGLLLNYQNDNPLENLRKETIILKENAHYTKTTTLCLAFIGAGNYASRILIPSFKKSHARLKTIACNSGLTGTTTGKKFGFEVVTTNTDSIFSDQEINAIIITTRHNSHYQFICDALKANKHVFVEKPLCLTFDELNSIGQLISKTPSLNLMIGFNRRFSPHIQKIKTLLSTINEPKSFIMTVNAGFIPAEHWTQNKTIGGGRLIGEACHFIDLLRFLAASPITNVHVIKMGNILIPDDKSSITLTFADGSFGTIHYLANGHKSFPKERLEVFTSGRILQLDNFKKLRGFGWPSFKKMNLWHQNKGQDECVSQFISCIKEGLSNPIPLAELIEVSRATLEAAQ